MTGDRFGETTAWEAVMFLRVASLVAGPFATVMGVSALVAEFTTGGRVATVLTMVAVVAAVAALVVFETDSRGNRTTPARRTGP